MTQRLVISDLMWNPISIASSAWQYLLLLFGSAKSKQKLTLWLTHACKTSSKKPRKHVASILRQLLAICSGKPFLDSIFSEIISPVRSKDGQIAVSLRENIKFGIQV